jgi:hypothetical protein
MQESKEFSRETFGKNTPIDGLVSKRVDSRYISTAPQKHAADRFMTLRSHIAEFYSMKNSFVHAPSLVLI